MPAVTMKWRLQYEENSVTKSEVYYIEFDAGDLSVDDLDDLTKQLQKLGFVRVQYGLIIT